MAVAADRFAAGHRQMMRLMVRSLDEEADESQAADARDGLGVGWVRCAYRRFIPTPIAVPTTLESVSI
jgi:hypothetical protein